MSLENETHEWMDIERDVSSSPPIISTHEGALECLRFVLKIDNLGSFETALVSSALAFFQQ